LGYDLVATRSDDEVLFKERGFGQAIGFGRWPAILIIDLVKAFTDADRPLGAPLDAQLAATNRIIVAARPKDIPLIFSTVAYDEAGLRDAGIWALKQKGVVSLLAGTDGPEIDPRLDRQSHDVILPKKYASCFFGTDLVPRLVNRRVDTLIITGCTTSGCVRASAVDACQNGFRPIVVAEAVGDRSQLAHDQSLFDLNQKYADVVSLETALQFIQTLSAQR
jgi:maleamate amidohydrolase